MEPPFLRDCSDEDVQKCIDEPFVLEIPSNSQFVERQIQLISQIGPRAATAEMRDGLARATIRNCELLPKCETKADYSKF